jgi:hypothetical protein
MLTPASGSEVCGASSYDGAMEAVFNSNKLGNSVLSTLIINKADTYIITEISLWCIKHPLAVEISTLHSSYKFLKSISLLALVISLL